MKTYKVNFKSNCEDFKTVCTLLSCIIKNRFPTYEIDYIESEQIQNFSIQAPYDNKYFFKVVDMIKEFLDQKNIDYTYSVRYNDYSSITAKDIEFIDFGPYFDKIDYYKMPEGSTNSLEDLNIFSINLQMELLNLKFLPYQNNDNSKEDSNDNEDYEDEYGEEDYYDNEDYDEEDYYDNKDSDDDHSFDH